MIDTETDDGIPQFVSVEEQTEVSKPSSQPAQVLDFSSLTSAIKAALEYERPVDFDPINFVETGTTTSITYVKLVEWIPKLPGGVLKEISMTSDPNAQYRLVVSGREMFKDKALQSALSIDYQRMRVSGAADKPITVYIKTPTGVSITISGLINGEQVL